MAAVDFDYVRFTWMDIHGIPRGRMVPRKHVDRFIKSGFGFSMGTTTSGPKSEGLGLSKDCGIAGVGGAGNCIAKPVLSTLHPLPWVTMDSPNTSGVAEFSVGEVFCETFLPNGQPQPQCPRYICRAQIDRLEKELGCQLLSGWEEEFFIVESDTTEPIAKEGNDASMLLLSEQETLLYHLESQMRKATIDIEGITLESTSSLFEYCLTPLQGISSADAACLFKQVAKEICAQWDGHGSKIQAVFMPKPFLKGQAAGLHFNMSLWNKKGNNLFHSDTSSNHLSEIARYWLAGLIKHSTALVALSSPTVNCYRRLHGPWAPCLADWGIDDRRASFRMKNDGMKSTYVENRLPSAASNPYLVVASTIAAGLDGIINKLELDTEMNKDACKLPDTLDEALQALVNDTCLTEQLGEDFIKVFIKIKRDIEIVELKKSDPKIMNEDMLLKEREQYMLFI